MPPVPVPTPVPGELPAAVPSGGKNIACLGWDENEDGAQALKRAAATLGARVAWLTTFFDTPTSEADRAAALAVLGQLYDAIICVAANTSRCAELERQIGVPVISASLPAGCDWTTVLRAALRS